MTNQSRPGGRPRESRGPDHAFVAWLRTCGRKPAAVAKELGVTESAIYSLRNGYFKPGLELSLKIERLTTDKRTKVSAVPAASWLTFVVRARPTRPAKRRRAKAA